MVTSEAIAAMKAMAMDPAKRVILAKRRSIFAAQWAILPRSNSVKTFWDATCIGGLIIVLSNQDRHIVLLALQTLMLLCENHEACKAVKSQLGIMDQLESILKSQKLVDESVKQLARQLFLKLSESLESSHGPLRDSSNLSRNSSYKSDNLKGRVKAKSIVLHIRGMQDKSDRELCSRLLLRVNGIISITFDMNKKRCILRTKPDVKPEDLASSIAKSMTMIAQQVIRNDRGEESLLNFNMSAHSQSEQNQEENLPDYLSDDSDHSFVSDMALRKPTDEDQKKSAGWFSKAANFLSSSFYW